MTAGERSPAPVRHKPVSTRTALLTILGLALAGVAYLVFAPTATIPDAVVSYSARRISGAGIDYALASHVVEFALNVALFVPAFCLAALLVPRPVKVWVLAGFALSLAIEYIQGVFLTGRLPQVRDIVANTLGAALGAGLAALLTRREVAESRSRQRQD